MSKQNESMRRNFMLSERDHALLKAIAEDDYGTSMSATLRRMIRQEADRRELVVPVHGAYELEPQQA